MSIYLARHGMTDSAQRGVLAAATEALNKQGEQDAISASEKLLSTLGDTSLSRIICSPRIRTLQTARIIAEHIGFDPKLIEEDIRLTERDCSNFVGQSIQDVFGQSDDALVAAGMEPWPDVLQRTKDIYDELRDTSDNILLVSHSTNVEPLVAISQQLTPEQLADKPSLAPSNILKLA